MLPYIMQTIYLNSKQLRKVLKNCGKLATLAKVSLQTTGLATLLLKTRGQYECPTKLIEMMKSAKYTIKQPGQAIKDLDFDNDTCTSNHYIQKRMENNEISKVINKNTRQFTACLQFASTTSAHNCFCRKKYVHTVETVGQKQQL